MNEELLNTREAAKFLRVSEVSIRRWTVGGKLLSPLYPEGWDR